MVVPARGRLGEVDFLTHIQRILEEGDFAATYKYALLLSLADLCVELTGPDEETPALPVQAIANKFVEYYWRQVVPFPGGPIPRPLLQNNGRQAAIARKVMEARAMTNGSIARARADPTLWNNLIGDVGRVVRMMPLWRLQLPGNKFLYENHQTGTTLVLNPGVAHCFRKFHGIVYNLVQGAWVNWIRRCSKNSDVLGQNTDLAQFLFGASRNSPAKVHPILDELQGSRCFYCEDRMRSRGNVDHFIPWVRYPSDLGHNFVLADSKCNNRKRDYLPGLAFLEKWTERNWALGAELNDRFSSASVEHDLTISRAIAKWAYAEGEQANSQVWTGGKTYANLDPLWRGAMGAVV